ncbi:MAG: response regulator transcription factor [Candidatus Obscuribacterales bacterium]|nr:response regulator transcription factor [Candidatus Obscuribacterales bacterium]
MSKILVVEDEAEIAQTILHTLSLQGFNVETANSGSDGLHRLSVYSYDVVVLDWMLGDMSGIEVLKQFRFHGGVTPVLMLTGRSTVDDKEAGLNAGADDYLTKPFHPRELVARVRALLRRAVSCVGETLRVQDVVLDTRTKKVLKGSEEIRLLPKEIAILEFLLRNKNTFFSTEDMVRHVWGSESDGGDDAVRQCVRRLRRKIDAPGAVSIITTRIGLGYCIAED